MQTGTIKDFFKKVGYDFDTMLFDEPIDISEKNWQVKSIHNEWQNVTKIVKKQLANHMIVKAGPFSLSCSPEHKIYVKINNKEYYEEVGVLIGNEQNFTVLTEAGWFPFVIENRKELIEIADLEVNGTNCYFSDGILSHNTVYGSPLTVPGGMAIPYAASVRIQLNTASPIKKTIGGTEQVIGVEVTAKTIKNKVGNPFREVSFEIHFGKGIEESSQLFDALREYCDKHKEGVIYNNEKIIIEGSGAWKHLTVSNAETGEVIVEEKFYKSEFGEIIKKHQKYIDALMDAAFIISNNNNQTNNSEEENKTIVPDPEN